MHQVVIEVGEYCGTVEFSAVGSTHYNPNNNYVARIFRVQLDYTTKAAGSYYNTELLVYKSFGNVVDAESWLLDTLEYPSFVHLLRK